MKETIEKPLATIEVLNKIKELEERLYQIDDSRVYDSILREREVLYADYNWFDQPYMESGRYGVKDVFGNVIIPAKFDDYVELFHYHHRRPSIPMVLNGKTVLVWTGSQGNVVPNTEYDSIHYSPYTGYYRMWQDGKFGFMTSAGTIIVDCICDEASEPINGVLMYRSGDNWGLFEDYDNVVAPKFDEVIDPMPNEYVKVRIGEHVGYINEKGEFTQNEDDAFWVFETDL